MKYTKQSWIVAGLSAALLVGCGASRDPDTVVENAKRQIAAGNRGEATIELKNLVQRVGTNVPARVLLAQIAYDQGDVQTADTELSRVKSTELTDPNAQQLRMRIDLALGRAPAVLQSLDRDRLTMSAAQKDLMRAQALRATGDAARSEALLRKLTQTSPQLIEPGLELVTTLLSQGRVGEAIAEADALLARNPKDPDSAAMRAQLDLRLGRPESAVKGFKAALAVAPSDWAPSRRWGCVFSLADAQLRTGKLADAKQTFAELEKSAPGLVGTRLLAAKIALLENRIDEGLAELQRIALAVPKDEYVQLLLAEALMRNHNREQAQTVLERLVSTSPNNIDARKSLARMQLEQNRPDKVVSILSDLPPEALADPETQRLLETAKTAQSRATEAVEVLTQSLQKDPDNNSIKLQLAAALMSSGTPSRALELLQSMPARTELAARARLRLLALVAQGNRKDLERAVEQMRGETTPDVDSLLAAADVTLAMGRADLANGLLDRALAVDPSNKTLYLAQATVRYTERKWTEAAAILDKVLKLDPSNVPARVAQARVSEAAGNSEAAQRWLEDARKTDPKAIDPAILLASIYLKQSSLPKAKTVLDALVAAAPTDGRAANAAGALMLGTRHPQEALGYMQIAAKQKPTTEILVNLARVQLAAGDRGGARASFMQVLTETPESLPANLAVAAIDAVSGQPGLALARLKPIATKYPTRPEVWTSMAEAYVAAKQFPEAVQALDQAYALAPSANVALRSFQVRVAGRLPTPEKPLQDWLRRSPQDSMVRDALASHFMRVGSRTSAITEYEAVVRERPNDPLPLNNLAWMLIADDPVRAEDLARRAYAIAPEMPQVADTLGWVLFKRGKVADAAPYLALAVGKLPSDGGLHYRYAAVLNAMKKPVEARAQVEAALATGEFAEREMAQKLLVELRGR